MAMELESAESIEGTIEPAQMRRRRQQSGIVGLVAGVLGGVLTLIVMLLVSGGGGGEPSRATAPPASFGPAVCIGAACVVAVCARFKQPGSDPARCRETCVEGGASTLPLSP